MSARSAGEILPEVMDEIQRRAKDHDAKAGLARGTDRECLACYALRQYTGRGSNSAPKSFYVVWRKCVMRSDLPPTGRHILHVIHEHMRPDQPFAFPSHQTIARFTGHSRSTISSYLSPSSEKIPSAIRGENDDLRAWLEIEKQSRRSVNTYHAAIPGVGTEESMYDVEQGMSRHGTPRCPRHRN